MKLSIVSPLGKLAEKEVSSVTLPGKLSSFTILSGHQPIISSLTPGILEYVDESGNRSSLGLYEGLVEFSDEKINILTNGIVDQSTLSVSKSQVKLEKAQSELLKIGTFSRESDELELEVLKSNMELALLAESTH